MNGNSTVFVQALINQRNNHIAKRDVFVFCENYKDGKWEII